MGGERGAGADCKEGERVETAARAEITEGTERAELKLAERTERAE